MPALPESFHPIIQTWFTETYGKPTAVQAEAWPLIEQGGHVLALAPTGSGKTLTAFLSVISRFCPAGPNAPAQYPHDQLTVLYVSPLKALNEDIKRNLLEPLAAIRLRFEQQGLPFPDIRVETRSGDTPQSQRRRFLERPPSMLALTPESLAILLLSPRGRQALATVKYLILDEIHAVLGNKRGAYLGCQIDRLAMVAGEFQRISLSATIRAPEIAAEFVGGLDHKNTGRKVHIVAPPAEKQIELSIEYPETENENDIDRIDKYGKRYTGLISYILNRISENSTLLVFTDSRRRAERLCYFLNEEALASGSGTVAFAHHGSLAKELRRSVERRLAEGSLPCVVATASLELGIDIGSVDEVVLAGSPGYVSQALQRIGRSGHGVGKVSRGKLFPFHGMDLLLASALKGAVDERDIEEVYPIENPLDILAQIIIALSIERAWNIEDLFTLLKGFYIFRNLNWDSYNRTVRMLAGLGEKGRIRELKPRIRLDAISGEISSMDGSLLLLYAAGGVIANRGLYSLRLVDGTKIGEVDEEFVWERRIKDCFYFGGRGWRITGIGSESVEIVPLENPSEFIPFWRGDTVFRSSRLSGRVLALLDQYNAEKGRGIEPAALTEFLDSQRKAQNNIPLACSTALTMEIIDGPESRGDLCSAVLHTFRGGSVNYPLSLALAQELEETLKLRVETFSNDDAILFLMPRLDIENNVFQIETVIRHAINSLNGQGGGGLSRGERLFRNRLEISGVFGAKFREAAELSLLLPKAGFGKRTPLWITRQRSKRLFDTVSSEDGFPVTAEAWRGCLKDMFDMDGFRDLLNAINDGSITLSFFRTTLPSPFSQDMIRQETNSLMYEYDERKDIPGVRGGDRTATLSDKVIEEALGDASLRPVLKNELVNNFCARLRRELPGWAPDDQLSLYDWVKERIAIPLDEWEQLCEALPEPLRQELASAGPGELPPQFGDRLKIMTRNGAAIASVVHREWETAWKNEALTLLGPWLRYEGPISADRITAIFGVDMASTEDALNALAEVDEIVCDVRLEAESDAGPALVCDRENLEMLLRLSRKKARPEIRERPAPVLPPFLAMRQGLAQSGEADASFLRKLAACTAPAKLWETEFCPARYGNYSPEMIDNEIREGRLVWYGTGKERIGLCPADDLDLVNTGEGQSKTQAFARAIDSGFFDRPRDFWEIKHEITAAGEAAIISGKDCVKALWQEVWQGQLSADSFEPVRRGVAAGFTPKDAEMADNAGGTAGGINAALPPRQPRIPRALRDRWKGGAPVRGNWFSLAYDNTGEDSDPVDEEYRNRDRVRLLLKRWGILCRPLLERESPPFNWSGLLPAMRRMELAGELIAGRFFAGINSLQFASPAIARELEAAENFDGLYWLNAADPASPAGLNIEGLNPEIPARLPSNRLYFQGQRLIALSKINGKELHVFITPDDSNLAALIALFKIPRTRRVLPEPKLLVNNINNIEAARSEYASAFQAAGFVSDRGRLCLW